MMRTGGGNGLLTVGRGESVEAVLAEQISHEQENGAVVVDDQNDRFV
jgi:hypothetical protein